MLARGVGLLIGLILGLIAQKYFSKNIWGE